MPLVRDVNIPLFLSFSLTDNNGKRSSAGFWLPNTISVTDAATYVAALETAIAGLSDARIERATVTLNFTQPDTYVYIAPASSEVERKLAVTFVDGTGFYQFGSEIPSPRFTLEVDGTDSVPLSNAALSLFADAVVNGPLGPGNGATTFHGDDLTRILGATVIHRNRKKAR